MNVHVVWMFMLWPQKPVRFYICSVILLLLLLILVVNFLIWSKLLTTIQIVFFRRRRHWVWVRQGRRHHGSGPSSSKGERKRKKEEAGRFHWRRWSKTLLKCSQIVVLWFGFGVVLFRMRERLKILTPTSWSLTRRIWSTLMTISNLLVSS